MPRSRPAQLTLEKTPAYLVDPKVPVRVRQMNPEMKLVLLVRDPVTRAMSDYAQAVDNAARRGRPPPPPFEQLAFVRRPDGNLTVNTAWSPVRIGRYAEHLSRWLDEFPRNQILVLSAERLVRDPGAVMTQLQKFLGLPQLVTEHHFYWDKRKGFHCLRRLPRRGRRKRRRQRCLARNKGRRHPPVSPERLRDIRTYFKPYNQQFYRMVGENFYWDDV
uniref:Sulfotransfer_1 domain-containing protein n=1 Tax=Macrostomum lignano TaxID=282301 RepID=A0A1I8IZ74_9PLAT